jgi:hypothetical protein
MTELPIPHQRGDTELPFPRQGFRIDHKPGFSFRAKDVAGVKILVKQNLFALGLGKILEGVESSIKQTLFERSSRPSPIIRESIGPQGRLLGQRRKGGAHGFPQTRKKGDPDVESVFRIELRERGAGSASLEKECAALSIESEQLDCAVAVPSL